MDPTIDHFFALTPDLLCIANSEGRLLRVSASWDRVLGYAETGLEGRLIRDFIHPEDLQVTVTRFSSLPGEPKSRSFLNRWRHHDGSWRWLEWSMACHDDLIYAAARNITGRKAAEQELERQRRLLAEAERVARVGTWMLDEASGEVTWSDEIYRITGRDPALPAPTFKEYVGMFEPESVGRLLTAFERDRDAPAPHDLELELVRRDGQHVNVIARTEAFFDETGRRAYTQGTIIDVTEHRRAEDALRANEAPLGVALVEVPSGRFRRVNPAFCEIAGRSERELLSLSFHGVTHPDDLAPTVESILPEAARGDVADVFGHILRGEGGERHQRECDQGRPNYRL